MRFEIGDPVSLVLGSINPVINLIQRHWILARRHTGKTIRGQVSGSNNLFTIASQRFHATGFRRSFTIVLAYREDNAFGSDDSSATAQLLLSRPSWMRSEQILQRTGFSVSEFSAAWSMLQIPRGAGHRSFAQDVSMAVKIWCREGGSNPHGCYPGGF